MSIIPEGAKIIVIAVKGSTFPHSTIKVGDIGHIHAYDSSDDSYKITTDTHTEVWIEATRIAPYVNEPVQATLENIRPLDVIQEDGRIYLVLPDINTEPSSLNSSKDKITVARLKHRDQAGVLTAMRISTLHNYVILHNLGDIYRDI